jgi:hypothetical protein
MNVQALLCNIQVVDHVMVIKCNAGALQTQMMGDLLGYPGEVS